MITMNTCEMRHLIIVSILLLYNSWAYLQECLNREKYFIERNWNNFFSICRRLHFCDGRFDPIIQKVSMGIPFFFFQRENLSKTRFNLYKEKFLTNKYAWHLFYEYLSTYRKSNHSFHLSRFFHTILALQLVLLAELSAHFDEIKNCKKLINHLNSLCF